jgi:hypothetical protein
MIARRAGELRLAADFSSFGGELAVGVLREPSFALSAAIEVLLSKRAAQLPAPVLIHALSTKVAGRCSIASSEAEEALRACCSAQVAVEWSVDIPSLGTLRALFLVTRFDRAEGTGAYDLVLQLAGKPVLVRPAESPDPLAAGADRTYRG